MNSNNNFKNKIKMNKCLKKKINFINSNRKINNNLILKKIKINKRKKFNLIQK